MTEDKIIEAESHYYGKIYLKNNEANPRYFTDQAGKKYFAMKKESEEIYRPDSVYFEVNGDRKFIDAYNCLTDNGKL